MLTGEYGEGSKDRLNPWRFDKARKQPQDIRTPPKALKAFDLPIRFHDVSTNRDIIVGSIVFSSCFTSAKNNVQIADLILVATAKYLMEFFDIPKDRLDIVTMDSALCEGIAEVAELPTAYDPTLRAHRAEVVVT